MRFGGKALRLAAALVGTALLGSALAGCGGNNAKSDEIRIGANFEMTGNTANYGASTLEGLKLAIKEANDAGGINGKKIELVSVDDKSEAAESINAATKLISDDHVRAIVGPATTANVIAESQVATDNKIPVIAPDATAVDVTVENGQVKPWIFRSCFIDPQQGDVMAKFALDTLKAKTAVIYLDNSTDYSKSLAQVFEKVFTAGGGKVLMTEAFLGKDQDFKATLTRLREANADVIFVPAYYEEVGIDAYQKEYGHMPNVFAALGYDAGKLLVDALKRAGSDDPEALRKALEETKDLVVGTGTITMDANHNPIKQAVILENKDGDRTVVAKIMPSAN